MDHECTENNQKKLLRKRIHDQKKVWNVCVYMKHSEERTTVYTNVEIKTNASKKIYFSVNPNICAHGTDHIDFRESSFTFHWIRHNAFIHRKIYN